MVLAVRSLRKSPHGIGCGCTSMPRFCFNCSAITSDVLCHLRHVVAEGDGQFGKAFAVRVARLSKQFFGLRGIVGQQFARRSVIAQMRRHDARRYVGLPFERDAHDGFRVNRVGERLPHFLLFERRVGAVLIQRHVPRRGAGKRFQIGFQFGVAVDVIQVAGGHVHDVQFARLIAAQARTAIRE